jgi:hypothetical protein
MWGEPIRWSGMVCVVSGALYALAAWVHPVGEDLTAVLDPRWVPAHLIYWVSSLLMLVGLVGIYARQATETGRLGLVAFVLALVGTALVSSILFIVSTVIPLIAVESPALFERAMTPPPFALPVFILGFGGGYILLGIATMRARVLPRWAGTLLIVGVTLFMVAEADVVGESLSHKFVTVGDTLFGFGFAWIGWALWAERGPSGRARTRG